MANDDKGPWWVVGVQIRAAMDPAGHGVEAFLAEHARQATDACLGFVRTIPVDIEGNWMLLVEQLEEQILAHTRFLCGQADLSVSQADRLMSASRRGCDRFVEAFRVGIGNDRGSLSGSRLSAIEAALAAGGYRWDDRAGP